MGMCAGGEAAVKANVARDCQKCCNGLVLTVESPVEMSSKRAPIVRT